MATFTVTTSQNIDQLASKTGGDLYNINGGTLTVDQDSRVGTNQSTSATLGNITISASLGGIVNIDGTSIWMIPYTGGSGTVPAWNTAISNNGASGKLIGVHSALTAASTATGAAMPASGFIRLKQKTGTFASGALTGITATASDAGRIGWIEIVGDEAGTVNANRLGAFNVTGAWYEIGTTNGTSNQTMQIPNNGLLRYAAGVYIEKTVGSGDYEFYPNNGVNTTTGTESTRGKVVWIDNTGLVRIGNSGAATNGFTPVTGLKVVIGNIFFENCTTAARTANVIPNATIATRYDFTTTGGGVVSIDKCNMAWYLSCSQAYSVNVSNSCFVDAILLSEVATAMVFTKVGVGNKPTTALVTSPLTITYCYAGGTFTDCTWLKNSGAAAGVTLTMNDIVGFTFVRNKSIQGVIRGIATSHAYSITRATNCTWTNPTIIQGSMQFITCNGINVTDTIYCDAVSGTTVTTYAMYVFNISSNTSNCVFSGLTIPVTNTQPYSSLLIGASGCSNIKVRNIGTRVSPLNMGTTNACGLIYSIATNCQSFKFQRIYVSNTRTGIMTGDNSCKNITEENVFGDYADAVDLMAVLNMKRKGMGGTGSLTAQTSVYGTHWRDSFTSTTVGRIAILMNEPTADTVSQVTLANGSAFTSVGGLYMPVIGHTVTFEMPEYMIGHTSFTNTALVMAGGTGTNYNYNYSIDKNDGAGWSTMTTANYTPTTLGTALNGLTGISASLGFKLRLKITTITTNATAITSVYLTTVSSTTAQDFQYPLDTYNLTLNGLVSDSDVVVLSAGTDVVLNQINQNVGNSWVHTYENATNIDIFVSKAGYVPFYIRNYSLQSSDASLPIAQVIDRNYII
jgi:hypothetical protein